jgi:tetratricopeptide (TPR) repeat protein
MFRTKSDVDRYASKIINKNSKFQKVIFKRFKIKFEINFLFQLSSEGLRIAKLYFEIKEYECAQNYLASFLSENPNDPLGWKLMGEIHEYSENRDWSKAIDCYSKYKKYFLFKCLIKKFFLITKDIINSIHKPVQFY